MKEENRKFSVAHEVLESRTSLASMFLNENLINLMSASDSELVAQAVV